MGSFSGELKVDISSIKGCKKRKEASATSGKRKNILEEMKEQKLKRAKLERRIETLDKEADTLSLEAEKKENIHTLSEANALRSKAKTVRDEELSTVKKSLSELEKELKVHC